MALVASLPIVTESVMDSIVFGCKDVYWSPCVREAMCSSVKAVKWFELQGRDAACIAIVTQCEAEKS